METVKLEQREMNNTGKFSQLGLSQNVLRAIEKEGFENPTEIQEKSIPYVLQGRDVIAKAATGSGKTLAFSAGILKETIRGMGVQSLILAPTRELAEQISIAMNKFSRYNNLKIISIYGGVSINPQIRNLQSADVVIGTPGRILDHINRKSINLSRIKILVLDEADRMLDMGFIRDVKKIMSYCPRKRQTLLFSATISREIVRLVEEHTNNPVEVSAEEYVDPKMLTQFYYRINDKFKFSLLKYLLQKEDSKLVMVFCNTRRSVDRLTSNLISNGINAIALHGGLSQDKRSRVMYDFNSSNTDTNVLICTDIAARGLDIKGVTHVYNYDVPKEPKEYIHRIGRTARAGKEGKVINIVGNTDYDLFERIITREDIFVKNEAIPNFTFIETKAIGRDPRRRFRREENGASFRGDNFRRDDRRDRPRSNFRSSGFRGNRSGSRNFRRDDRSRNNSRRYSR